MFLDELIGRTVQWAWDLPYAPQVVVLVFIAAWTALLLHELARGLVALALGIRPWSVTLGGGPVLYRGRIGGCQVGLAVLGRARGRFPPSVARPRMTFRLPLLALLLAGCAGGAGSTGSKSAAPRPVTADSAALAAASEIMRLEEAWGRALSNRDTAFFRRILADDFVGTGGVDVQSKATVINELARGSGTVPPPRFEQAQVRLFGEIAVVTGIAAYRGPAGTPTSRTRFTEVWVKRAGRWQAVHGHYNTLPPQTP